MNTPRMLAGTFAFLVLTMNAFGQSARPSAKGITQVPGIRVGHFTLPSGLTGCTVILADGDGAIGGVAQRGGAPGTRETDLLDPTKFLEEKNVGYKTSAGVVPIVPAAVIFDLPFIGTSKARPTADCGYKAAAAATNGPVQEGNVGAGAGATIGKINGNRMATKAGIGSAAIALPNGLIVGALVAVNAVGDVIDPSTGAVVAGARDANGKLADARKVLRAGVQTTTPRPGENTTIGVVATNAKLTKPQAARLALMADDGLARALFPAHTLGDGDTVFALATGAWNGTADVSTIGALAADVMAEAIVRAAVMAKSAGGLPAAADLGTVPARFK
jgi:L-aminopeptidase/D-esterase-like protein